MSTTTIHMMRPGSHERPGGAECICDQAWDRMGDHCSTQPPVVEVEDNPNNEWRFNKKYKDLEQVAPFLPDFMKRCEELTAAGKYRYNSEFKGRIPGIAGKDEDTGIYLLQGLADRIAQDAKVAALLADGYRRISRLEKTTKFAHVVLYPITSMSGAWYETTEARVVPYSDGSLDGVLEKGKRTHGFPINGRAVLVKD